MWKLFCTLFCLTLALFALEAQPVLTGEWTGTIDVHDPESGAVVSTNVRLFLQQNDGTISGKVGRDGDSEFSPVQHARREGNKFFFETTNPDVVGPVKFALILDGDRMEGEMKAALDSGEIVGKVKVSREKK